MNNTSNLTEWENSQKLLLPYFSYAGIRLTQLFCYLEQHGIHITKCSIHTLNHFSDLFPDTLKTVFARPDYDLILQPKYHHFYAEISLTRDETVITLHFPPLADHTEK